jgi:outer membrane protein OmpA-like peptidoglycan-associated protein
LYSVAQNDLINIDDITDCDHALNILAVDSFGFTTPPPGSGRVIEYKSNSDKSLYFFENEHHTSWYRLSIPFNGLLTFDIVPLNINDDYDFILYKYTDTSFCKNVKLKKLLPVRTAISRNDKRIDSKTGLSVEASSEFIHSGPGESYSRALKVNKGEIYYLVLDNCYENGMGHKIIFRPLREFEINGKTVEQQNKNPAKARVSLISLSSYDTVASVFSDPATGSFKLHGYYKDSLSGSYELIVNAPGYFYYDTAISASDLLNAEKSYTLPIPRLEKGKRIRLNNINFYGNTTVPYPETKFIFIKLLDVMVNNPNLVIQIEGHTNGCKGGFAYSQNLSDARANAVKNYLLKNGINPKRVYAIGLSCRFMIYPEPKNELEGKLNRRVEIKVISF